MLDFIPCNIFLNHDSSFSILLKTIVSGISPTKPKLQSINCQ